MLLLLLPDGNDNHVIAPPTPIPADRYSSMSLATGTLNSTVGITSLLGVLGISGVLGEVVGVAPVLNIAAGMTMLTGLIALLFLPTKA